MTFKLGVVGHKDSYAFVKQVVSEFFNEVDLYHAEFGTDDDVNEAIERIHTLMDFCDGLLYSGYDPYLVISGQLSHTIPVRYVATNNSHLITSLLRGVIQFNAYLTDVSIDNFDRKSALDAFSSVGIDLHALTLRIISVSPTTAGFVGETLSQHIANYKQGSTLCVTNINYVNVELTKLGIPAVSINPSKESFVHEIRNMMLRQKLLDSQTSRIATLSISIHFKEKYNFYREMPLREIDEYAAIEKLFFVFAERVDGAVFGLNHGDYRIICESNTLQNYTNNFTNISLMENIIKDTAFAAIIGIGLGKNPNEACANSLVALNRSRKQQGTNTHIMVNTKTILGPIVPRSYDVLPDSKIDERLMAVSDQTGISFGTINKLYQSMRLRSSLLYSSTEIAEILGVTRRTANRIIERLVENGGADIVGKNISSQKGRPNRIIKLLF